MKYNCALRLAGISIPQNQRKNQNPRQFYFPAYPRLRNPEPIRSSNKTSSPIFYHLLQEARVEKRTTNHIGQSKDIIVAPKT